jgi:hypothetical protein
MKTGMLVAMAVLAASVLFGGLGCQQAYDPGPGWTVAYSTEAGGPKLSDWTTSSGKLEIVNGGLVVNASDAETLLTLKNRKFPGSAIVECVASVTGEKISDISPMLSMGDSGWKEGYLLQFGGKANTLNRLMREGEEVGSTVKNQPLLMPGKTYHVVAVNDGGKLSLLVDGVEVFQYRDTQPLKGAGHDRIGFYTYHTTLKLDKVTVYVKKAGAAGST